MLFELINTSTTYINKILIVKLDVFVNVYFIENNAQDYVKVVQLVLN